MLAHKGYSGAFCKGFTRLHFCAPFAYVPQGAVIFSEWIPTLNLFREGACRNVLLFLHICKKKVQVSSKTALFYLEVGPLRCWKLDRCAVGGWSRESRVASCELGAEFSGLCFEDFCLVAKHIVGSILGSSFLCGFLGYFCEVLFVPGFERMLCFPVDL